MQAMRCSEIPLNPPPACAFKQSGGRHLFGGCVQDSAPLTATQAAAVGLAGTGARPRPGLQRQECSGSWDGSFSIRQR